MQLLFVLTAALFDASIACWSGKYTFNKPRPITAANVYPEDFVGSLPLRLLCTCDSGPVKLKQGVDQSFSDMNPPC